MISDTITAYPEPGHKAHFWHSHTGLAGPPATHRYIAVTQTLDPFTKRVLEALVEFYKENGYAPSLDEIYEKVEVRKNAIIVALGELEKAGYIRQGRDEKGQALSRGIAILKDIKGKKPKFTAPVANGAPGALTERQAECLREIKSFIKKNGFSPTAREIAERMNSSSGTVGYYFKQLSEKGYIGKPKSDARAMYLKKWKYGKKV